MVHTQQFITSLHPSAVLPCTCANLQSYGRQYMRDTLLLTAAAYLMDLVEHVVKEVRGGKVRLLLIACSMCEARAA